MYHTSDRFDDFVCNSQKVPSGMSAKAICVMRGDGVDGVVNFEQVYYILFRVYYACVAS